MSEADPRAFVAGWPIKHSRSPLIHNYWLKLYGLPGLYERMEVQPETFPGFIDAMADKGYRGGNVTLPHKEAAFRLAQQRTDMAISLQAANTLWFENGVLCADNTDVGGFLNGLDAEAPGWDTAKIAVVLGAGGAARAIVQALMLRNIERIFVVNRTVERAIAIAALFNDAVKPVPWQDLASALSGAGLLVNTTSLGMAGQPPLDIDLSGLSVDATVDDIVYVPLETPLLAQARRLKLRCVNGLSMLLHQAVPGFERWFGLRPEVTPDLRRLIEEDILRSQA
jgi:shikimate dehydrogenase